MTQPAVVALAETDPADPYLGHAQAFGQLSTDMVAARGRD